MPGCAHADLSKKVLLNPSKSAQDISTRQWHTKRRSSYILKPCEATLYKKTLYITLLNSLQGEKLEKLELDFFPLFFICVFFVTSRMWACGGFCPTWARRGGRPSPTE